MFLEIAYLAVSPIYSTLNSAKSFILSRFGFPVLLAAGTSSLYSSTTYLLLLLCDFFAITDLT